MEEFKLDDVTFEQAQKLKNLGFDWNCGLAFDKDGNEVNWTTKQFYCWKPTVQLALKFIRKRFGINHDIYTRSWDKKVFGYSISFSILSKDLIMCDLSCDSDKEEDGIVSFDYDEASSIALDYAIRYLLKNKF
jgi:hypothetical protein